MGRNDGYQTLRGWKGFSIQHGKGGEHLTVKNTISGIKTFGMVSVQTFIEV